MRANPLGLICRVTAPALFLAALWGPSLLSAQTKVLIYYNSDSLLASTGPMTAVTGILTAEGAIVTSIGVSTTGYCPTGDNWGAYNQVWDLRLSITGSSTCPDPSPADDAFTACWQSQAVAYLESGGSLYLTGEFDTFNSKNQGISDLLLTTGAVSSGYTDCPGPNGNGTDNTNSILPCNIPGQSGPTSFFGVATGGIPIKYLNGSNFVSDPVVGDWGDGTNRSIVSGWQGSLGQMTNLTGSAGNLVTVWDANILTQPFFAGVTQTVNTNFVQSIYCFLGGGTCAMTPTITATYQFSPTNTLSPTVTSTFTPTPTIILSPTVTLTPTGTFTPTNSPTITNSFTPTFSPTVTPTPYDVFAINRNLFQPSASASLTITVGYSHFPGPYSLKIYNSAGEFIRDLSGPSTTYLHSPLPVTSYTWDGTNQANNPCTSGVYLFYLVEPFDRKMKKVLLVH